MLPIFSVSVTVSFKFQIKVQITCHLKDHKKSGISERLLPLTYSKYCAFCTMYHQCWNTDKDIIQPALYCYVLDSKHSIYCITKSNWDGAGLLLKNIDSYR